MSDRAAVLGKDLSASRAAIAEASQAIERIEPESPAEEELKLTLQATVRFIQSLHAGRAILETATLQAWDLIPQQLIRCHPFRSPAAARQELGCRRALEISSQRDRGAH